MSLKHSPEGNIDRKVLLAVAGAIKSLETVTGTVVEYEIGVSDAQDLSYIVRRLWAILESSGHTIDVDSNRLSNCVPCQVILLRSRVKLKFSMVPLLVVFDHGI